MIAIIKRGLAVPPLAVCARNAETPEVDAIVTIEWGDRREDFACAIKARSTPRAFEEASRVAQTASARMGLRPLIVLPFLSAPNLEALNRMEISGLDLSGNACVIIPGELLVYRSGNPNQFKESLPTRYAYRGTTSLVPRVFLVRGAYQRVSDIVDEIAKRGAKITLATVSKALRRLEDDVLISRRSGEIRLLQPDGVLDKLRSSYRPPRIIRQRNYALSVPLQELVKRIEPPAAAVLTGASSASLFAVGARSDVTAVYSPNIDRIARSWEGLVRENDRFPDIELLETEDPLVYFDVRTQDGLVYASPVQAYLELADGDKRDRQIADQIRDRILDEPG